MDKKSLIIELVETFLTSIVVLMVIYWGIARPEVVLGASMEPTISDGERILVDRLSPRFEEYERGDIIVLHPPDDDNIDYIKRVVGLPGDIVKIKDCNVFISRDGDRYQLEEPYLSGSTCTTEGNKLREGRSIQLEYDEYLVLGDNRERSVDSRLFGLLKEDRIIGRVVLRFWPIDQITMF